MPLLLGILFIVIGFVLFIFGSINFFDLLSERSLSYFKRESGWTMFRSAFVAILGLALAISVLAIGVYF